MPNSPPRAMKLSSSSFMGANPPPRGMVSAYPLVAILTASPCRAIIAFMSVARAALPRIKGIWAFSGSFSQQVHITPGTLPKNQSWALMRSKNTAHGCFAALRRKPIRDGTYPEHLTHQRMETNEALPYQQTIKILFQIP